MIVISAFMLAAASFATTMTGPRFTSVGENQTTVSIQIGDLRPGDVRFFTYGDQAEHEIRFLLARDATGRIRAAIDACEHCYLHHQGYASSHGSVICRFCGNRYKLEAIESGLASCVPLKLPFQVTGHTVTIKSVDLERARGMF